MRLPRMSGNAWVCTIIALVLFASGAEQVYHRVRGDVRSTFEPPKPPPEDDETLAPKPGEPAPQFRLADAKGQQHSLAQYHGKRLVVHFFCGCSRCEAMARKWAAWQKKDPSVSMIGLVFFDPKYAGEFRQKTGVTFPLVKDPEKKTATQYHSLHCPRAWVVDGQGRVVFTDPHMPDMIEPDLAFAQVKRAYYHPESFLKPNNTAKAASHGSRT
jgi:peroxiredoxin